CVLVKDQAPMNCGRSAGIIEYPSTLRISAPHTAATIAAEGPVRAELAEVAMHHFARFLVDVPALCSTMIGEGVVSKSSSVDQLVSAILAAYPLARERVRFMPHLRHSPVARASPIGIRLG